MRIFLLLFLGMGTKLLMAGTGHTNDMGLMYLALLVFFGLILLFWNGVDHLRNNHTKYIEKFQGLIQNMTTFLHKYFEMAQGLLGFTLKNS